ncbi:uncharacterized protein LOC143419946 [Maylandia zebra]|uniref:uncharacterized protein LOC143419946 n=1 Tax=Maylandia zebra TaxID=106582 RepID=UPI00403D03A2
MRVFKTRGCLLAAIRIIFLTEFLLTSVRGDGADSETLDIKYVLIGGGIGLLLVAVFIITKICIIRKQVSQNNEDVNMRRFSEPQLHSLSHLSQSERSDAAVSRAV